MKYPNLLRRYLATVLDVFALWCIVYAASKIPSIAASGALAYWALGLLLLSYEPLLTAYACTLGQAVMRIRVRTVDSLERISLDQLELLTSWLLAMLESE